MPDHWPHFGSDRSNEASETIGSSSANGAEPGDAGAPTAATDDTTAEVSDNAAIAEAADDSPPAVAESADPGAPTTAVDDQTPFLVELVRAMQTAAGLERVRVGEEIDRRRHAHIDGVRARQASEADRIRELAAEDLKTIDAWADGERQRIDLERERRAGELQKDLETSLAEHSSKIDAEVGSVEAAITAYRAQVDLFFAGFDRETDPILIARQAGNRPAFPDLEAVAQTDIEPATAASTTEPAAAQASAPEAAVAEARPEAAPEAAPDAPLLSEQALVGVMDPESAAEPAESWAAPAEASYEPGSAGQSEMPHPAGAYRESAEPVTAAASPNHPGSLLSSVPVSRPMSWLRRGENGGDRPNNDR
jgi:hypothetical protein